MSKKWIRPGEFEVLCGFGCTDIFSENKWDTQDTENLIFASLPVVSKEKCLEMHTPQEQTLIHNSTFCTFTNTKTRACFGDSGGPFVIDNNSVGINSWGTIRNGRPNFFTRISEFTQWIENLADVKAV